MADYLVFQQGLVAKTSRQRHMMSHHLEIHKEKEKRVRPHCRTFKPETMIFPKIV
jgi:hypothetical protein